MEGFFEDDSLLSKHQRKSNKAAKSITAFDKIACKRLYYAIDLHNNSKGKRGKTALQELSLLRQDVSEERIKKVIKWYSQQKPNEHLPIIHSARSFRLKFKSLESVMKKSPFQIKPERLTKKQFQVYQYLIDTMQWPPTVLESLPTALQASWNNFTAFHNRLHYLEQKAQEQENKSDFELFVIYAANLLQSCPVTYFTGWYTEFNEKVFWDRYTFKLHHMIWQVTSIQYEMQCFTELCYYGPSYSTFWKQLIQETTK